MNMILGAYQQTNCNSSTTRIVLLFWKLKMTLIKRRDIPESITDVNSLGKLTTIRKLCQAAN